MPSGHKTTFTYPEGQPLILGERLFNAPRELVWSVLTDAKHYPNYWGPSYLKTVVEEMDVRPGGKWRITQTDPQGAIHKFQGEYREVVKPEKIVQTFGYADFTPSVETMTLEARGAQTLLKVSSVFASVEDRNGMRDSGMEGGASETYDRLDAILETLKQAA